MSGRRKINFIISSALFLVFMFGMFGALETRGTYKAQAQMPSAEPVLKPLGDYTPPPMFSSFVPLPAKVISETIAVRPLYTGLDAPSVFIPIPPPRKRPSIFHAPPSFIAKARREAYPPPLEQRLITPSKQDVLKYIEP